MRSETIAKGLGWFSTVLAYLGALVLLIMMFLTTADVAGRYLFNKPILGTIELTEIFVLIMIFSFLAHTQAHKGHISVDLLVSRFSRRTRLIIELGVTSICLILMGLIVWMSGITAQELKASGQASNNLHIPKYPFALFVVLGCSVMCIEYVRDLLSPQEARKKGKTT
jgi:TRAP-type C4-dicarboxylate transport system permease small subunit